MAVGQRRSRHDRDRRGGRREECHDGTVAIATGLDPDEQVVTAGVTEIDSDMRLTLWTGASR